jgi:hypothetical protein
MSQFICPDCGTDDCKHMIKPGAATPVAIVCGGGSNEDIEVGSVILCDDNGQFARHYQYGDGNTVIGFIDTTLDNTTYTPVGQIRVCPSELTDACVFNANGIKIEDVQIDNTFNPARIYTYGTTVQRVLQPNETVGSCNPASTCEESNTPLLDINNCTPFALDCATIEFLGLGDANVVDDNTADVLCETDGVWVREPESADAPFPVSEPFMTDAPNDANWKFYGNARLTSAAAGNLAYNPQGQAPIDSNGNGWLRLTNNENSRFGAAIIDTPFPSTQGFVFEFEAAIYGRGTSGADGLSVFLLDGAFPITGPGAEGGALGYSYNTSSGESGVPKAYIGIGIHEFPSFAMAGGSIGQGQSPVYVAEGVTIRGSGDSGAPGSNTYTWIATTNTDDVVPGSHIQNHTRNDAFKVRGAVVNKCGQILVSVWIDFDGTGFKLYHDGIDVTAVAGTPPTTFKIGFGAATGAERNVHEIRNLKIGPAGKQYWRGFEFDTATLSTCATDVRFQVTGELTFTADSQVTQGGDADFEQHQIVVMNRVTGEIYKRQRYASRPTRVGETVTFDVTTNTIPTTDLANVVVLYGAEVYDLNGEYGTTWENIETKIYQVGCPPIVHNTIPISAPCPINVRIIGGLDNDGNTTPAPTVNTSPGLSIVTVCGTVNGERVNLLRYETIDSSNISTVLFFTVDGTQVTPDTWTPGNCPLNDVEYMTLCDDNGSFLRAFINDGENTTILDTTLNGTTAYTPVGTVKICTNNSLRCLTCRG